MYVHCKRDNLFTASYALNTEICENHFLRIIHFKTADRSSRMNENLNSSMRNKNEKSPM